MTTTEASTSNQTFRDLLQKLVWRQYLIKGYFFMFAAQLVCFLIIFNKVVEINICLTGSASGGLIQCSPDGMEEELTSGDLTKAGLGV